VEGGRAGYPREFSEFHKDLCRSMPDIISTTEKWGSDARLQKKKRQSF
jgi:hypothetical protein